jgi:hypothetical protein
MARDVPIFICADDVTLPGVRISAIDKEGKLAIDQVFVPRPHG